MGRFIRLFTGVLGGKKPSESLTAWGVFIFGVGYAAEESGFIPKGLVDSFRAFSDPIGSLFMVLGLRKAATASNTSGS